MNLEFKNRRYVCEPRPLKWKPNKMTKRRYWQEVGPDDLRYELAPYELTVLVVENVTAISKGKFR